MVNDNVKSQITDFLAIGEEVIDVDEGTAEHDVQGCASPLTHS